MAKLPKVPILHEMVADGEHHPANYISYMGELIMIYRKALPGKQASQQDFADSINEFIGGNITRARIKRAEQGNLDVAFGVYAAIYSKMEIWPDILHAMHKGRTASLRYNNLVYEQLSPEIKLAEKIAKTKLEARANNEKRKKILINIPLE